MNMINSLNNQNGGVPSDIIVKAIDKSVNIEKIDGPKIQSDKGKIENHQVEQNQPVDPKKISEFVEKANQLVLIFDKSIKFVYNSDTGKNYIDIVDNNTNEIVKKIPSESMRRFLDAVEGAVGMIVDEKA